MIWRPAIVAAGLLCATAPAQAVSRTPERPGAPDSRLADLLPAPAAERAAGPDRAGPSAAPPSGTARVLLAQAYTEPRPGKTTQDTPPSAERAKPAPQRPKPGEAASRPRVAPPAELDAIQLGCLTDIGTMDADGDFARAGVDPQTFCVSKDVFTEGGLTWTLQIIQDKARPGLLWVVPHDNEDAAFETAVAMLRQFGGTVVAVETGGQRNNRDVDPNRSFGEKGTRCARSRPFPLFTQRVLRYGAPDKPIIALHTNARGYTNDGREGSGTISIRKPPSADERAYESRQPFGDTGTLLSEDEIVYLATTQPHDTRMAAAAALLNIAGLNVIVEQVTPQKNDCSLSNYAALHNYPYFNVEVVDRRADLQKRMVPKVMELLGVPADAAWPPPGAVSPGAVPPGAVQPGGPSAAAPQIEAPLPPQAQSQGQSQPAGAAQDDSWRQAPPQAQGQLQSPEPDPRPQSLDQGVTQSQAPEVGTRRSPPPGAPLGTPPGTLPGPPPRPPGLQGADERRDQPTTLQATPPAPVPPAPLPAR